MVENYIDEEHHILVKRIVAQKCQVLQAIHHRITAPNTNTLSEAPIVLGVTPSVD